MPTKTGAKIRIIVLGTGPDAEEAREIAAADADVAIAAKFTKTVTHLLVDDTVKSSEARVKKAEETGVPVIKLADLKELLVDGATVDADAADADIAGTAEPEEAPAAEAAAEAEPELAAAPEPEPEPEPAAEAEPEPEPAPEPIAEAEPEAAGEPAAEPESEKVVPAQAEAPKAEREPEIDHIEEPTAEKTDADGEEPPKPSSKPGFMAKLKSIFGRTGADR
ncbi:hypothetical protein [Glycomyces arizonensis]|uniref:hypothetical protein n=1 Tax=Glycomyces arizonensis TaxID=256035 RepID=UPI000413B1AF|nr:hypothetical protein [Glycomyces arizonensis]